MLQAVLAGATVLLVAAGVYQLWTGRLTGTDEDTRELMVDEAAMLSRDDVSNPTQVIDDGAKLRNLVMIGSEVVVLVLSAGLVLYVATRPGSLVGMEYKALLGVCFLVGAYLLGRALFVRLGLARMAT